MLEHKYETKAESHFTPWPYHLALPLRFARSRVGVGVSQFPLGRRVGGSGRAIYPFKRRFSRGTLQTEGYNRFPRMHCESPARWLLPQKKFTNVNIFSINKVLKFTKTVVLSSLTLFQCVMVIFFIKCTLKKNRW